MTAPDLPRLYAAIDGTWPPANMRRVGPFTIREAQGGGKRVAAATLEDSEASDADIALARTAMKTLGQPDLFMLRADQDAFDQRLAGLGYDIVDPVNLYLCETRALTGTPPPPVTAFHIWPPLAIMREIWAAGGIGPARLAVMDRAKGPKTAILGRMRDMPGGTAFVALHGDIAMLHALEVPPNQRRKGMARHIMSAAAIWADRQGASHFAVLVTKANTAANALYASLGMRVVGQYHYRLKDRP